MKGLSSRVKVPVSFNGALSTDKVMQGWNEGVMGMQAGGKRMILVPPGLAYGSRNIEKAVPANASLMFMFDVLAVEKKQ